MQWYARLSVVWLALLVSACHCETPQQAPHQEKLRALQGRWRSVIAYSRDTSGPAPKVIEKRIPEEEQVEVEFVGNVGIVRKVIPEEDDRFAHKPAPFACLVDAKTDPMTCDLVSYPFPKGRKPDIFTVGILKIESDKLYIATSNNTSTEERPKLFDPAKDEKCVALVICERVKR